MSVSSTSNLQKLDAVLYDRPAGRNIVGHAIETITSLRAERDALRALLQKLRGSMRLYRGGGVAGQQMGNESYSILVTGHTLGDIDAALAGDKP